MSALSQLSVVFIVLGLISIQSSEAIKCYTCSSCEYNFNERQTVVADQCTACKTTVQERNGNWATTRKECARATCEPSDTRNTQGTGTVVDCCESDLCNAAVTPKASALAGTMTVLLGLVNYFAAKHF